MDGASSLTFQTEDPFPESIHNVFQSSLICDIEEMFVIRVAGDVFDLFQKGFWINSSPVVITKNLDWRRERKKKTLRILPSSESVSAGGEDGARRDLQQQHIW